MIRKTMLLADLQTSILGFGCASLGSRVSAKAGVSALEAAYDAGITWFDVAPAYGAGDAEAILGGFVANKRASLYICSKIGLAPPRRNELMRLAYGFGRPVIGMAQGLRRKFRGMRSTRNVHVALNATTIEQSIDRSLQRLGTDYLDVFALHKPSSEDISRPEIMETLARIRASGKARYIGVAGDAAAAAAALAHPEIYSVIQIDNDPFQSSFPALRQAAQDRAGFITHSVLGVAGALDRIVAQVSTSVEQQAWLREAGYVGDIKTMVVDLLIDRALVANANGVTLLSMFSGRHLAHNLARASGPLREDAEALVERIVYASSSLGGTHG